PTVRSGPCSNSVPVSLSLLAFPQQTSVDPSPRLRNNVCTMTSKLSAKELGVSASTDNRKSVRGADIVILGVNPQVVGDVLKEIKPELGTDTLVISVAASVPTAYIEQRLGEKIPVIRAMPNTC